MRYTKRFTALALAGVLTLALAGCGESDPLKSAQEKISKVTSLDASVTMDMGLKIQGQEMNESITMNLSSFTDPVKAKVDVTLDIEMPGEDLVFPPTTTTVYLEGSDSGYTTYTNSGTSWQKASLSLDDASQYDAKSNMQYYMDKGRDFTKEGTDKLPGGEADRYAGVISGANLEEVMQNSGVLGSLGGLDPSLNLDGETLSALFTDLPDLPVVLWLDQKTGYPVQYKMDMKGLIEAVLPNMLEAAGVPADQFQVEITRLSFVMTCSNFNAATDFEIPAEAKT